MSGTSDVHTRWVRVQARIEFITAEQGGRAMPIVGGCSYRPNHNFFEPNGDVMAMGFIELPPGKDLHPGEAAELDLLLSTWPGLEGELYPGRQWRIKEGGKLVGKGTILQATGVPETR